MTSSLSNLASRVLIAIVAIPAILYVTYVGGVFFFLFVTIIALLALGEFYGLAALKGASPQRITGFAGTVALNIAFFHERIAAVILPLFFEHGVALSVLTKLQLFLTLFLLFIVLILLVELFRNAGSIFLNAGFTILGLVYIGLFLATLVGLRELFGNEFPYWLVRKHLETPAVLPDASVREITYRWGGLTVIAIFATIWMCDTAAYFGGLAMGRHKLFERVSPKKTWEGAVWGFVAAVLTMGVAQGFLLPYLEFHQALLIGVIVGTLGQTGDLVESLFKRDAGVKDSSSLIPGHGGVLDRFDSLIFVAPILYLYIDFVVLS